MRTATFFLTVLLVTIISSSSYAAPNRCPRQQVKTQLNAKLASTRVFQATSEEFSDYILGPHRGGGGGKILGFVNQSEIYTKFKYNFDIQKLDENRYCVNLTEVKGYFYAAPKLYLPTDYKKSSCEYKEVYKHEKRHLKTVYDFHKQNTGKFKAHLGRIARKVPTLPPVSTQAQVNEVKQTIASFFESEFREFEQKAAINLMKAQQKIDSPSEYRGVRKRCSNW